MNATARLSFDSDYFSLFYSEWLRYRSRYRRRAVPIALVLSGIGIALAVWCSSVLLAVVFVAMGVADLTETLTYRKRWMSNLLRSRSSSWGELSFSDSEVQIQSENARGTVRYEGFQSAIATPKSIFLIPHKGVSLFVPLATIEPQDAVESLVAFLLQKIKGCRPS